MCCSAFVSWAIRLSISAAWKILKRLHNTRNGSYLWVKQIRESYKINTKQRERNFTCAFSVAWASFKGFCLLQSKPMLSSTEGMERLTTYKSSTSFYKPNYPKAFYLEIKTEQDLCNSRKVKKTILKNTKRNSNASILLSDRTIAKIHVPLI